jgi:hypothetical protein
LDPVDVQILKEFVDWGSSEWAVLVLSMGRGTCMGWHVRIRRVQVQLEFTIFLPVSNPYPLCRLWGLA